jgi:hypothetical protein
MGRGWEQWTVRGELQLPCTQVLLQLLAWLLKPYALEIMAMIHHMPAAKLPATIECRAPGYHAAQSTIMEPGYFCTAAFVANTQLMPRSTLLWILAQ